MDDLRKEFRDHVAADREEFRIVNQKLDQIIGQWKLIGAIMGVLAGLASGWMFG